jgi:phenylalanine-4-hydroxylase
VIVEIVHFENGLILRHMFVPERDFRALTAQFLAPRNIAPTRAHGLSNWRTLTKGNAEPTPRHERKLGEATRLETTPIEVLIADMPSLDIETLRAKHPAIRPDFTIPQEWERYTPEEHQTWRTLYRRQLGLLPGRVCNEFMDGLKRLEIGDAQIPNMEKLSEDLTRLTGWSVVAVPSLVPDEVFFDHLANRRFPAGQFIRKPDQLDYIEEPDVFHDVFGHVPMLANPVFANYMEAYGKGGQRAMGLHTLHNLARLYWYTVEFGLIATPDGMRIYGAGIASSSAESIYAIEHRSPNRVHFDLERVMRTKYRIDDFQESYFVIDSFDELFGETYKDFGPLYLKLAAGATHEPGTVLESDRVHHRGTRDYKPNSHAAA